jgi:hypothetical protein
MSVATLVAANPSSTARLLADVSEDQGGREPVVDRLAGALGRELAEQLVAELSNDALSRLDAGLTPAFVDRLAELTSEAA